MALHVSLSHKNKLKNSPIVSILIPVYNRENFIAPCIESALSQTFTDLEVIVVDNASSDETWSICQHYAELDSRVRIFRNDTNIGPVRNWLSCVEKARGEFVKILWSDDLIHSDFLNKLLPYLNDEKVGFVYSSADIFFDDYKNPSIHSFVKLKTDKYESRKYIEAAFLNLDVPYSPGCAIFRASDVKNNLLLNVPSRVNSDFTMHAIGNDLLLFLLTAHQYEKFAVVKEPLAYFRVHCGSITTSADSGKIPLHYDLVKGYFSENHVLDIELQRKLNVEFLLHMLLFNSKKFGIKNLTDFYPTKNNTTISWSRLFQRLIGKIVHYD